MSGALKLSAKRTTPGASGAVKVSLARDSVSLFINIVSSRSLGEGVSHIKVSFGKGQRLLQLRVVRGCWFFIPRAGKIPWGPSFGSQE